MANSRVEIENAFFFAFKVALDRLSDTDQLENERTEPKT